MSWFNKVDKKVDNLTENLDSALKNLDEIGKTIKDVQELMVKMWRAEDMEENDGKFRWPFDEHGNLLENVNLSKRLN